MPVDTKHPAYLPHEEQAERVRDAVAGTDAVKRRGVQYLPHPVEEFDTLTGEEKTAAEARYTAYKRRAVWLGVTKRTHDGLLGAAFRKTPEVDLPTAIAYMEEDADGSGMGLTQFAKVAVSGVIRSGRHGVLVDYPEAPDGLTREQTRGLRATLRTYDSASIVNWRREGELLTLVVLREPYERDIADEFDREYDWQYRVLRLEDGQYTQQVYRDLQPVGEKVTPRRGDGSAWTVIPFQFLGALTNDEVPDAPLLLDIADLNLAHYRNSASLEEMIHIVGQAMVHVDIGETSTDEWKELNPNGIRWGSRAGIQTRGGGTISLVQAEERSVLTAELEKKEQRMLSIGARLLTNGGQNETAEAVRARSGAETANLSTVAHNVSAGLQQCLAWALEFMRGSGEAIFELSQQFYPEAAEPQMIMAMIQGVDRGLLADTDWFDWARKRGLIDPERSDDDIRADAQTGGTALGSI